jgi:hypothetical protein
MIGHLPSAADQIAGVLRHHGFRKINTTAIDALLQGHKEAFIDDLIGSSEQVRREALAIDDLLVITAFLHGYVPQCRPLPPSIAAAPLVVYGDKEVA